MKDSAGMEYYTFGFGPLDEPNTVLNNLVIGMNQNREMMEPYVVRYVMEENARTFVNRDKDSGEFEGDINLHRYTDFFDKGETFKDFYCPPNYDQQGDPIPCEVVEILSGSGGGGSGGSGGGSPSNCTASFSWSNCGGPNGNTMHSAAICGNGSGAGWVVTTDCDGVSSSTPLYKIATGEDCDDCNIPPATSTAPNGMFNIVPNVINIKLDNVLLPFQIDLLYDNPAVATDILNFLVANNDSLEAREFVLNVMPYLYNGATVNFTERLIDDQGIYNDVLARMSPSERTIYDNELSSSEKALYLTSAANATIYAQIFYPNPVRNRVGDAIKHTLFNALNVSRIGSVLTKKLGDAHEDINYSLDCPNHFKETQMDLFNNQVGRNIGAGQSTGIVILVEGAKSAGNLRYLNNLEYNGEFWKATNSSTLTPTN